MAWIGPAIGAGASLVGNMMSQSGQQATNAMSMQEMLQQEQWQTSMSNTAMQRRVADLKAAGLNPVLAVGEGGASTPGISAPTMQNAMGGAVSAALNTASQIALVQQTKAQTDLSNAQRVLVGEQTREAGARADMAGANADYYLINRGPYYDFQRKIADATSANAFSLADVAESAARVRAARLANVQTDNAMNFEQGPGGQYAPYLRAVSALGNSAYSIANPIAKIRSMYPLASSSGSSGN